MTRIVAWPHLWPSTGSDYVDAVCWVALESTDFRYKSTKNHPKALILQGFYGSGRRSRKFESCHLDHFGSEKRFSEPFSLTATRFLRGDRESGKHLLTACSYLFDNFGLRYKVHDCYRYDISYHIQDWCPNKPRHIEEHCPIVRNECTNNNDQKQKPKGQWG